MKPKALVVEYHPAHVAALKRWPLILDAFFESKLTKW
jgi:hypothetical protein